MWWIHNKVSVCKLIHQGTPSLHLSLLFCLLSTHKGNPGMKFQRSYESLAVDQTFDSGKQSYSSNLTLLWFVYSGICAKNDIMKHSFAELNYAYNMTTCYTYYIGMLSWQFEVHTVRTCVMLFCIKLPCRRKRWKQISLVTPTTLHASMHLVCCY